MSWVELCGAECTVQQYPIKIWRVGSDMLKATQNTG